jgi:endonuclease III
MNYDNLYAQKKHDVRQDDSMLGSFAPNVYSIADILINNFPIPNLYDYEDPLDELLFIVCSIRTNEKKYLQTYNSLRNSFPSIELLAKAPIEDITTALAFGGLASQKATAIKGILTEIIKHFGTPTLEPLKHMSDTECEHFLVSLPWVGKKAARCVMMCSLSRQVFPVDVHCWRICCRLGWVNKPFSKDNCSPKDMDYLQSQIPPELRHPLHMIFIQFGRDVCTAINPKCHACPISPLCPKKGLLNKVTQQIDKNLITKG